MQFFHESKEHINCFLFLPKIKILQMLCRNLSKSLWEFKGQKTMKLNSKCAYFSPSLCILRRDRWLFWGVKRLRLVLLRTNDSWRTFFPYFSVKFSPFPCFLWDNIEEHLFTTFSLFLIEITKMFNIYLSIENANINLQFFRDSEFDDLLMKNWVIFNINPLTLTGTKCD